MKKTLSLILALSVILTLLVGLTLNSSAATPVYTLVTSIDELSSGDKIVFVCKDKNVANSIIASNATTGVCFLTANSVEIENDTIISGDLAPITLGGSKTAGWTLTVDGKLISANAVKEFNVSGIGSSTWNISIENTVATVASTNAECGNIQYNSNNPRFLCYTSKQNAIAIFKLVDYVEDESGDSSEDIGGDESGETSENPVIDGPAAYTLVVNPSDLKAGDQIIFVCPSKNVANGILNKTFLEKVDVTIANNTIKCPEDDSLKVVPFTLGGNAQSGWTFSLGTGLLSSPAAKSLNITGSGVSTWNISISGGVATVSSTDTSFGKILYNASNPRFTTYTSDQTPIALYKLTAVGTANVTGVTVDETASVYVGKTVSLFATVLPSDAADKTVTWSSSAPEIAKVDSETGVVTGVKAGEATITVKTNDGSFTDTCVVTVSDEPIYTIAEVKALELNTECLTKGVVTFVSGKNAFIQDSTGGINIYRPSADFSLNIGDELLVSGKTTLYGEAPELGNTVIKSKTPSTPVTPLEISLAALVADPLAHFGELVKINEVEIVEYDDKGNAIVSDGRNTAPLYKIELDPEIFTVGTEVSFTAIAAYFNGFQFQGYPENVKANSSAVRPIITSLGAKVNMSASAMRLGASYDASRLTSAQRASVEDIGILISVKDKSNLELKLGNGFYEAHDIAINEYDESYKLSDYDRFVFYATITNIPENEYDTPIIFRPFVTYDGLTSYGEKLTRTFNQVAVKPKIVSAPSENVAYKLGVENGGIFFATGEINENHYGVTTKTPKNAADIYVIDDHGEYTLKAVLPSGETKYINLVYDNSHYNFVYGDTPITAWHYENDVLSAEVYNGSEIVVCWIGAIGNYTDIGAYTGSAVHPCSIYSLG